MEEPDDGGGANGEILQKFKSEQPGGGARQPDVVPAAMEMIRATDQTGNRHLRGRSGAGERVRGKTKRAGVLLINGLMGLEVCCLYGYDLLTDHRRRNGARNVVIQTVRAFFVADTPSG
jgi:hypothetical protein